MNPLPSTLDSAKLIEFLKSSKINMDGIPDRRYAYALGRNQYVDTLLIAAYSGEFDEEPQREEAEGLK